MNKVFLNGYLAQDPKQRITSKGIEQASFSLGVTDLRNYNESYFFPCVAWSQQAKYINNNLKKGSFVAIDGRLTRRSYVDVEGKNVYITEVIVDNIKQFGISKTNQNVNVNINDEPILDQPVIEAPTAIADVLDNVEEIAEGNSSTNNQKSFDWDKDLK